VSLVKTKAKKAATKSLPKGKLRTALARAKREKWDGFIRTASDEAALLEGCYFSWEAARRVEDFGKRFIRLSTGRWDGQPFELMAWQRDDIFFPLFGWLRPDGRRRFRFADVFTPKKNGKSGMCSFLSLNLLCGDGEARAEVYAAATDRAQASLVFDESSRMVKKSPALASRLSVFDSTKTITYPRSGGMYKALAGEYASSEGKNIHGLICDELHAWNTPTLKKLFDSLYYGGIAREQPLSVVISTVGEDEEDESSLWMETFSRAQAILKGEVVDTRRLAFVAAATKEECEGDGWLSPKVHKKANPSYGITIDPEEMSASAQEAKDSPPKKARFLRYRLNRPASTTQLWLPMDDWKQCGGPLGDLAGRPCCGGIDLSTADDLTAWVMIFPPEGIGTWSVLPRFFVHEGKVKELERQNDYRYRTWQERRLLVVTPDDDIDYEFIRKQIQEDSKVFQLGETGFDPWNARQLAGQLSNQDGLQMVEVRQGYQSLSEPSKLLEKLIRSHMLRHGDNEVLTWMAGNVKARTDENYNIRPVKPPQGDKKKIDGVVATIIALSRALVKQPEQQSYYETHEMEVW
jgi:phage terminase large subunit-like protein